MIAVLTSIVFAVIAIGALGIAMLFFACDRAAEIEKKNSSNKK